MKSALFVQKVSDKELFLPNTRLLLRIYFN